MCAPIELQPQQATLRLQIKIELNITCHSTFFIHICTLNSNREQKRIQKSDVKLIISTDWSQTYIVMIDSITKLCLSLLVCANGLSCSGEETRPTLGIKAMPNQSGIRDHKQNKQQLLHRIQSVR
jgi:hypothetical protein